MGAVSLNKFVITATTTLPAETLTAGTYGTASGVAGTPANSYDVKPLEFIANTVIVLDSGTPDALYTALNGLGILRAWVDGQDDVGHAALSN